MNINVGNTPMLKISYMYKGKEDFIFAKLESFNMTGSIKDRGAHIKVCPPFFGRQPTQNRPQRVLNNLTKYAILHVIVRL